MKELSLNILDIAMNSVRADANTVKITLSEDDRVLKFTISDNGCGMKKDFLERVMDPFSTTRKTRSVGLGLPFLKLQAELTGGSVDIRSISSEDDPVNHGTVTEASFCKTSIDFIPLGDIVSTVVTLVQGNPGIHWVFKHEMSGGNVFLDTDDLKNVLGDISLATPEVVMWMTQFLKEAYSEMGYDM